MSCLNNLYTATTTSPGLIPAILLTEQLHISHKLFFSSVLLCVCICVFCDSLVEEGEQVSHNDEGFAWQRLQNFLDMDCPLLEALHCWKITQPQHPGDYSHNQVHKQERTHTHRQRDPKLTDTGYEIMEDFFREEGVVQSSKVKLQDTSDGVHVVVILVPCQRVLTYKRMRGRGREGRREEGGGKR